jgi:hypothetical protein
MIVPAHCFFVPTSTLSPPSNRQISFLRGWGNFYRPLQAHFLTSALESLAMERFAHEATDWFMEIQTQHKRQQPSDTKDSISLPLYPLPAVYVPSGKNIQYILQNIEPRNIQMAVDLAKSKPPGERRFCVSLRAIDTGRLARRGTILSIIDIDKKLNDDGKIYKIVLTCVAEKVVDILEVENPYAADLSYRLNRPQEYLRARVSMNSAHIKEAKEEKESIHDDEKIKLSQTIAKHFNRVREYLIQGFGADELPPFARQNLAEALPLLEELSLLSVETFWESVYLWQTYAYTVREGYQQKLASDRNEMLIAGALKKGGPLNLPVHMTDLMPEDREQVVNLEEKSQKEWISQGLEPCIDFQALLAAENEVEQLVQFSKMVARECERLTAIALLPTSLRESSERQGRDNPVVKKGAWFDDNMW